MATTEREYHSHTAHAALFSRRSLLKAGVTLGGTTLVGAALGQATSSDRARGTQPDHVEPHQTPVHSQEFGAETVKVAGNTQAGITTPAQAHLTLVGLTVHESVEPQDARRLMRVLTQDITRLTQGEAGVADQEAELAALPANLTVTVGVGAGFFRAFDLEEAKPHWLVDLPAYRIDQLDQRWCGGDLVLQICGDDPLAIAHARKVLVSQTRRWTRVKWMQTGFTRARGAVPAGTTMRNLMGQIDGTVNPDPLADDALIFVRDGSLWDGGTAMVARRIAMNLDTWEEVDRGGREDSVGRYLSNGAPLGGLKEHDAPNFQKTNELGFPLIADYSHVARATAHASNERIYRRGYNYDDAPEPGQSHNTGLIFISFQADIEKQYMPIQQRLADLDSLNEWTTPIGSATFAIFPALGASEYLGADIIEPYLKE